MTESKEPNFSTPSSDSFRKFVELVSGDPKIDSLVKGAVDTGKNLGVIERLAALKLAVGQVGEN